MEELRKKGHDTAIGYASADKKTARNPDVNSYYLPWLADWDFLMSSVNRKQLLAALDREEPDVVHIHGLRNADVTAVARRRYPVLRFVHDPGLFCPAQWKLKPDFTYCNDAFGAECVKCLSHLSGRQRNLLIKLRRREIEETAKSEAVMVASAAMKDELVRVGVDADKVHVLPLFARSEEPLGEKEEEGLVVFIGTVHRIKGVDVLLRAAKKVAAKGWRLVVIGGGPTLGEMKNLAGELGLNGTVTFTGWLKNDEARRWIARSSILVMPSVWLEGFGIVGLEAMCESKPVIGSNVGGIRDWLRDGKNGLLVTPGREDELAGAIERLLANPEKRVHLGENGRKIFEKEYRLESHMRKLLSIYEKISVNREKRQRKKTEFNICPACRSNIIERAFESNGYPFIKCLSCGCVTTQTPPDEKTLREHYDLAYSDGERNSLFDSEEFKRGQAIKRLERLEEFTAPGVALDVGSSFGFFLDEARKRGWTARGLEISQRPFEYSTKKLGLDVKRKTLGTVAGNNESYDAVLMWDVLEHLAHPEEALLASANMLKSGGVLGLSVPNGDSWLFSKLGGKWDWVIPPSHLHFFTPNSMLPLLERCGFEIVSISSGRGDSDNEWLLYFRAALKRFWLDRLLFERAASFLRRKLNRSAFFENRLERYNSDMKGSELVVWAKKR